MATKSPEDIHNVVNRINTRSAQELNKMDDYASAWQQVQNDEAAVWGGHGYGVRGVNWGKAIQKGKDAGVNQLTLLYGGRNLLHEMHLVIAHGYLYGLMGPNGCGKLTLLKKIASKSVTGWPLHLSVQMVEQEVLGTPQSVLECMTEISQTNQGGWTQKRQELEEEIAALELVLEHENADDKAMEVAAERLSEIYDQLEVMDKDDSGSSDDDDEWQNRICKAGCQRQKDLERAAIQGIHAGHTWKPLEWQLANETSPSPGTLCGTGHSPLGLAHQPLGSFGHSIPTGFPRLQQHDGSGCQSRRPFS